MKTRILPTETTVVVQQIMTVKNAGLILPEGGEPDPDTFDFDFKVIEVGSKVEGIIPGDIPVFQKHATFQAAKVIEKSKERQVLHSIFYATDIVAVERTEQEIL